MEDTLRVISTLTRSRVVFVLILVLMEDTLREKPLLERLKAYRVLILVLMEDTLRESAQGVSEISVVS